MNTVPEKLRKLRDENADVALILDTYQAIEKVYLESLKAMGMLAEPSASARSSAELTFSFDKTPPTIDLEG